MMIEVQALDSNWKSARAELIVCFAAQCVCKIDEMQDIVAKFWWARPSGGFPLPCSVASCILPYHPPQTNATVQDLLSCTSPSFIHSLDHTTLHRLKWQFKMI